jgi:hypothetical protein
VKRTYLLAVRQGREKERVLVISLIVVEVHHIQGIRRTRVKSIVSHVIRMDIMHISVSRIRIREMKIHI